MRVSYVSYGRRQACFLAVPAEPHKLPRVGLSLRYGPTLIRGDLVYYPSLELNGIVGFQGNPGSEEVWVIWNKRKGASGHGPAQLVLIESKHHQLSLEGGD